jgi:hypothetical protein
MATPTPEELNKQFEKLQRLATTLNKNLNNFNLKPVAEDAALVGELIEKWGKELDDSLASVNDLSSGFQSVVQEISQGNIGLAATKKTFNSLTSIAQQLSYEQAGINKLSEKELQTLLKKSQQAKVDATANNIILNQRKDDLKAENLKDNVSLEQKKKNREEIKKINGAIADNQSIATANTDEESQTYKDLIQSLKSRLDLEEKIGKTMGIGGAAVEGVATALDKMGLGGLGKALGLDEVKAKMKEVAETTAKLPNYTGGFADKMTVVKAGAKEAGKQLKASLQDPTVVATFLVKQFIDALQSVDSLAGDTAKQFNLSYQEASKLNSQLNDTANLSGDAAVNTKGLNESMMAVGKTLGSNAKLNDADLITFTKLREQAGYTNEELASIQTLSLANGKSLEDNTAEILGSAQAYASQNKLIVNEKEVLREVGKASASLKLSLGGSTAALAESVVKAKQFGLNLEQASKISSGLLNFEESISSEIEAELLTGKELNLEEARRLALNGDIAGAAAEVAKQVGSSAQFGKMNVIQQEAIAKSVGMSRDELAQSLIDKEALNKLSGIEGKDAKEKFDNLVKQVGMEEAKKQLGNDQLANQYNQQSAQEKLANITSKLQELFISIAEPVLAIVSPFIELATKILPLVNIALFPIINGVKVVGLGIDYIFNSIKGVYDMFMGTNKQLTTMQKIIGSIGAAYLTYQGIVVATNIVQGVSAAISEEKALAENASFIAIGAQKVAEAAGIGYKTASAILSGTKAIAEVTAAEALTLGLVTFAIIGGLAAVYSAMTSKKVADVMSPAKGKTQISTKEGELLELSENDDFIAAPGLLDNNSKNNNVMAAPGLLDKNSNPKEEKSIFDKIGDALTPDVSVNVDLSPLIEKMDILINAVKAGGNVYLDATKVGTAMNVGTYKVQ